MNTEYSWTASGNEFLFHLILLIHVGATTPPEAVDASKPAALCSIHYFARIIDFD